MTEHHNASTTGTPQSPQAPATQASFRIGVRVPNVAAAQTFYQGLGFTAVGVIPGSDGEPVMSILAWDRTNLILDALSGMPFPDSERERRIQEGPRGLGVAIGVTVDDLATTYDYCCRSGCTITSEPSDEPWGVRVFECLDPYGYLWELSTPLTDTDTDTDTTQALAATAAAWYAPES